MNAIQGALEGNYRLERMGNNMNVAFTYGKPIKLSELSDPHYGQKTIDCICSRD